ncbi:MAG: cache domain-containing protein [Desulfuromonadaceae bacterium]|nr:cache domain-containing protein [Desulfuromonadaceae bacterium]
MAIRNKVGFAWNLISLVGMILAVTAAGLIIVFTAFEMISETEHAYLGLMTYFLFPGMMIFGLLLVPIGAWRVRNERRKATIQGMVSLEEAIPNFPILNLNDPNKRNMFIFFVVATVIFVIVMAIASIKGFEFTESTTFCGELCHPVMTPEYTAWQNSPHAKVRCVECHVGPGATWYVKAKISGMKQLYGVLFHTYPETIETPIDNLRPARETCEHCHWPDKFSVARQKIFYHYAPNEDNTPRKTDMLIHIGGNPMAATSNGIHWHIGSDVSYITRDKKRIDIPYIAVKDKNGKLTEYMDIEKPLTKDEIAKGKRRQMDCTDCHNRPTHIYHSPSEGIDLNFVSNRIDRKLPYLKKVAVEVLNRPYKTKEEGFAAISRDIPAYYAENYPQVAQAKAEAIKTAVVQVRDIYEKNFFPAMKVNWSTYPNNIGHFYTPGCFRCHDDKHRSAEGRVISKSCELCHEILGQIQENIPAGTVVNQFVHPVDIGDDLFGTNCSDCHSAGGHDIPGEGNPPVLKSAPRPATRAAVPVSQKQQEAARAMVKSAVAYLKANGKAKTLTEISDTKGQFVKGEQYLFVIDLQGRMLAHGVNPTLVGKGYYDFKDPDGKYFFRDFISVARKGSGWVDYKWINPVTMKTEPKTSYVELVGDIIIGCGIYR